MNKKVLICAIAGGSCSGKTTFANKLWQTLGPEISDLLYQDNYYIDQSHRFDRDGGQVNFDHPDSIDFQLLGKHLAKIQNLEPIEVPIYDFKDHKRLDSSLTLLPKKVVILDGTLILHSPHLAPYLDIKVFLEAPEALRFERRLKRDVEERGRTPKGVHEQFHRQVAPMHNEYVDPSKHSAHFVANPGNFSQIFELFLQETREKMARHLPCK